MTAPPSPKGLRGVGLDEGHLHPGAGRVVRALGPGPAAAAVPAAARRADPLAADAVQKNPDLRCAAHGRRPGPIENGVVPQPRAQRGMIRPVPILSCSHLVGLPAHLRRLLAMLPVASRRVEYRNERFTPVRSRSPGPPSTRPRISSTGRSSATSSSTSGSSRARPFRTSSGRPTASSTAATGEPRRVGPDRVTCPSVLSF